MDAQQETAMKTLIAGIAFLTAFVFAAQAQHNHHGQHQMPRSGGTHGGHGMHGQQPAQAQPAGDAARAFADANMKMHRDMDIRFSGNADVDFARGMIPHHQGAIDMAEIVLRFGKDAVVRKLATEVIAAQRKEIAQMQAWLAVNGSRAPTDASQSSTKAFTDINAKMHKDMSMTFTGDADVDFMQGMVPHHEGAVEMAKVLLQFGNDPELRKLADDVIRTQNDEIKVMKDWLAKRGQGGHKH
jgi:uncharacterized protein (DUF305 family)